MSNLILVPENLMGLSGAVTGASSYASVSMDGSNLASESPSEFFRSSSAHPARTILNGHLTAAYHSIQADTLALVGHNLYRGDEYRVGLHTSNYTGIPFLAIYPTGTISSTNASSTSSPNFHLDVDESDLSLDGNWITPTTGTDWNIRFSFATPGSLELGAKCQAFSIRVKAASAVSTGAVAPTVKCELFETGGVTALVDCGTKTISSTTGQWLHFSWNAALLASADGSGVEVKLTFAGRDLSPGAILGYPAGHLGQVTFGYRRDTIPYAYDMGWQTYDPFAGSDITYAPEVQGQGSALLSQFGALRTFNTVEVCIRSDRSPADYDPLAEILPTPVDYVQAGCMILGETWSPSSDRDFGPLVSTKDYSSKARTYGGQRFGSRRFVQRILSLPLNWLTPAEAHTLFDRLLWRQGILKPILVSILPGDATEEKHTTFLATLRNPENAMTATTTRGKSRSMNLEFEEEL